MGSHGQKLMPSGNGILAGMNFRLFLHGLHLSGKKHV